MMKKGNRLRALYHGPANPGTLVVDRREVRTMLDVLNEEIDKCIKKLRNATSGAEIRTFITEYEELMFKKSNEVVKEFLKQSK